MDTQRLTVASYVASGVGIALMLLNFLFPFLFPDRGAWSDVQAREYAAAAAELHRATHEVGHAHDAGADAADGQAELAAAQQQWDAQEKSLNGAMAGRHVVRSIIKWTGIILAVLGIAAGVFLRFAAKEE